MSATDAHTLLGLSLALFLAGCGGSDDAPVTLYKPTGSVQCAATLTTQLRLDAEVASLSAAGALVTSSGCANDGVAHPSACGQTNGDLFVVAVAPGAVSVAQQMGFAGAGAYPNARSLACQ